MRSTIRKRHLVVGLLLSVLSSGCYRPRATYTNTPECAATVASYTPLDSEPDSVAWASRLRNISPPESNRTRDSWSFRHVPDTAQVDVLPGQVLFEFYVDESGHLMPESLELTGELSGSERIEYRKAIETWTLRPAKVGSCWVPGRVRIQMDWTWGRIQRQMGYVGQEGATE